MERVAELDNYGFSNVTRAINRDVSSFAEKVIASWNVPGLSIGAVRLTCPGEFQPEFLALGKRNEDGDIVTEKTLFNIGSCSKVFLANAMGILMDDFAHARNVINLPSGVHSFTWDTKILELLPSKSEWLLADPVATAQATVRDILMHVTGLAGHDLALSGQDTALDVVRNMRHLKPQYKFREVFSYNNLMYVLGAHIISTYSGMPFTTFVQQRIFRPLCMNNTTYFADEADRMGRLSQSWNASGRRIPFWIKPESAEWVAGPGGVISSAVDMTKWIATLLNQGVDPCSNRSVIPHSVVAETGKVHWSRGPSARQGYGMGWELKRIHGHDVIIQTGYIPGFNAHVMLLPSCRAGIVALTNMDGPQPASRAVPLCIIEVLLGMPHTLSTSIKTSSPQKPSHRGSSRSCRYDPGLPCASYAGTYYSPGYGALTLYSSSCREDGCQQVLADFAACSELLADEVALYAAWPRLWSSHVRMRHHSGNTFALSCPFLFPRGYGKNTAPFAYKQLGDIEIAVEFVVRDGRVVGFGVADVVLHSRRPSKLAGCVEDNADIWFARLTSTALESGHTARSRL